MQTNEFFRLFAYDHWANCECLAAMRSGEPVYADMIGRMSHILSAQKLWLERIERRPQSMAVWPVLTVEDCVTLTDEMWAAWRNYLTPGGGGVAPDSLDAKIEYRNTKGELWTSRVEDVLTHVLFHSAYHRGQIALQMRTAGMTPAATDFIHAVRQGLLE